MFDYSLLHPSSVGAYDDDEDSNGEKFVVLNWCFYFRTDTESWVSKNFDLKAVIHLYRWVWVEL